jgi:uncharacterized protein (DUF885 family)
MNPVRDFAAQLTQLEQNADREPDSTRLWSLFELSWDIHLNEYPESASMMGYDGYGDRWTDQSLAAIARRAQHPGRELEVLHTIDRARLSPADQLNYDLFEAKLADQVESNRFPGELMPINQMGGIQQNAASTLEYMPTGTLARCEEILARLRGLPEQIDQTIALADSGLKAGITPPEITLRDVPDQVRSQIVDDPSTAPLLVVLAEQPATISDADWKRITGDAYTIYREQIVPSFERLYAFLTQTYIPGCRTTIGLGSLPDGDAWYRHAVRHYTTTELTPDDIFTIGQSEVARIRAEMEAIIASTGFQGDFAAFTEFLRTDSRFFFDTPEALLSAYRDICKRVDPQLVHLFGTLPRLPYGVVEVPSYSEKSQTTAYYQPGSARAARPGYFYANTYDLKSRPSWEMAALTLHEAVPGHHLQIALSQELKSLPKFRSEGWYTAYGEGWALYAESLGETMGMYDDPYVKFGQLTYEMWRAIRLVVDVGMHVKGWSRQQAIDYFRQNSAKTEHDITVEIDRYIAWPGQALAYKIGELKIKELRAFAELELGNSFDLRTFHDEILGDGGLPLDILDRKIRTWVAEQKEKSGR